MTDHPEGRTTFAVLRDRTFGPFLIGKIFSSCGNWVQQIAAGGEDFTDQERAEGSVTQDGQGRAAFRVVGHRRPRPVWRPGRGGVVTAPVSFGGTPAGPRYGWGGASGR